MGALDSNPIRSNFPVQVENLTASFKVHLGEVSVYEVKIQRSSLFDWDHDSVTAYLGVRLL